MFFGGTGGDNHPVVTDKVQTVLVAYRSDLWFGIIFLFFEKMFPMNSGINKYMPQGLRPIPFERMIFVGDGETDIPTMKMLTYQGGHSIAVYDEARKDQDLRKIHQLIADGRVNFVAPANYSENSQLEIIIKGILGRMEHQITRS